jgi:hypothetical protein
MLRTASAPWCTTCRPIATAGLPHHPRLHQPPGAPNENNTAGYIARGRQARVDADSGIDLGDARILRAIVDGIIRVECAGMPYDGSEIDDGLELAGVD